MLKRLSFAKIELFLTSALASALGLGILAISKDLPYHVPCAFFFGEPEYPLDEK